MRKLARLIGARLPVRAAARLAATGRTPKALAWHPEPPIAGDPATARRLVGGVLLFDGRLVETAEPLPWDLAPPDALWAEALHGHGWLDDAAASGEPAVWDHLSAWAWAWLERFTPGEGPGWQPDILARRLTRQIAYSIQLLGGQPREKQDRLFHALGVQTRLLGWHWPNARIGVEQLEALTGYVNALISLEGDRHTTRAVIAELGHLAETVVAPDGAIASRNPEELARIVSLLTWSASAIEGAEMKPAPRHLAALNRAAPALQTLRHPGGALARFHGGRSGQDMPLDRLLEEAGIRTKARPTSSAVMGYLRLETERSVCLVDAAGPPSGPFAATGHASALAMEFSAAGCPLIVQSGTGRGFGARLARASRRGPSHSTVELAARCPATVYHVPGPRAHDALSTTGAVTGRVSRDRQGVWALLESTQFREELGLIIERRLHLSADGLRLAGEDTALAPSAVDRARIARHLQATGATCSVTARFYLHPAVKARLALAGRAVALDLPDGTRWLMRAEAENLALQKAIFFDASRAKPRATMQILAKSTLLEYWGRITWSLERLTEDRPS